MAVRRAKDGSGHLFTTWFVKKTLDDGVPHADLIVTYWAESGEWLPWDSDAKRFTSKKEAEAALAGFILTAQDGENFWLEADEERHTDIRYPRLCPECARLLNLKNQSGARELKQLEYIQDQIDEFDGRSRQPYDEDELEG